MNSNNFFCILNTIGNLFYYLPKCYKKCKNYFKPEDNVDFYNYDDVYTPLKKNIF